MTTNAPIAPPFDEQAAERKVQAAEELWNSQDAVRVAEAYTIDTRWRNRERFIVGREAVTAFLRLKWERERNYRLRKELFAFRDNRIAVRFEYEYLNASGQWFRAHGNENWVFESSGLMAERYASINEHSIAESQLRVTPGEGRVGVDTRRETGPETAVDLCGPIPHWRTALEDGAEA